MSEELVPIIIVPVIFFCIAYIIKSLSDNGVRRKLAEKGLVDENIKYLFQKPRLDVVPNSLKWGMVLIAIGVAFLVGQMVPHAIREEATISAMFILSGLALVAYHFIATKKLKDLGGDETL